MLSPIPKSGPQFPTAATPVKPIYDDQTIIKGIQDAQKFEKEGIVDDTYSELFWDSATEQDSTTVPRDGSVSEAEMQHRLLAQTYGKPIADFLLGQVLLKDDKGHEVEKNDEKAVQYLLQAFRQGFRPAGNSLLTMFFLKLKDAKSTASAVPQEIKSALQELAQHKNPTALYLFGVLHLMEDNSDLAYSSLKDAFKLGHADWTLLASADAEKIYQHAVSLKNLDDQKTFCKIAAGAGNTKAMILLSQIYESYVLVECVDFHNNIGKANGWLDKAVQAGDAVAQEITRQRKMAEADLIQLYFLEAASYLQANKKPSTIFTDNTSRVMKMLAQAARNNNPTAHYLLGVLHLEGLCDNADQNVAVAHFVKAAELRYKNPDLLTATKILTKADALWTSRSWMNNNESNATKLYQLAATNRGGRLAIFDKAVVLWDAPKRSESDKADAIMLFKIAAFGETVPKKIFEKAVALWDIPERSKLNEADAKTLFQIAANSGHFGANLIYDKALLLYSSRHKASAVKLFTIVANAGNPGAMFALYQILFESTKTANKHQANIWLNKAADLGLPKALEALEALKAVEAREAQMRTTPPGDQMKIN